MKLHELSPAAGSRKAPKRLGRGTGSGLGRNAGKGEKGQKARSGAPINPLFEGGRSSLIMRLKKVRGFKSRNAKKSVVKLEALEKAFKDGEIVSLKNLISSKLVKKADEKNGVKILATGTISKKLTISAGILLSQTAKDAIIKAGGKVI